MSFFSSSPSSGSRSWSKEEPRLVDSATLSSSARWRQRPGNSLASDFLGIGFRFRPELLRLETMSRNVAPEVLPPNFERRSVSEMASYVVVLTSPRRLMTSSSSSLNVSTLRCSDVVFSYGARPNRLPTSPIASSAPTPTSTSLSTSTAAASPTATATSSVAN